MRDPDRTETENRAEILCRLMDRNRNQIENFFPIFGSGFLNVVKCCIRIFLFGGIRKSTIAIGSSLDYVRSPNAYVYCDMDILASLHFALKTGNRLVHLYFIVPLVRVIFHRHNKKCKNRPNMSSTWLTVKIKKDRK